MKTSLVTLFFAAALAATLAVSGCNKSPSMTDTPSAVSEPATPVANTPATRGTTATGNIPDVDVTQNVQTAFQQNELLKGADISVVSLKGDVRLVGALASQTQIDEATKVARTADGVQSVQDELTIKK